MNGRPSAGGDHLDWVLHPKRWMRLSASDALAPATVAILDPSRHRRLGTIWSDVRGIAGFDVLTGWIALMTDPPTLILDVEIACPACRFGVAIPVGDTSGALDGLLADGELVLMTEVGLRFSEQREWGSARQNSFVVPAPFDHTPVWAARVCLAAQRRRARAKHPHRTHTAQTAPRGRRRGSMRRSRR